MNTVTFTDRTGTKRRFALIAAALAFLAIPAVSQAQGVFNGMAGGAAEGSYRGSRAAGPVGGVVGGAVGAGVGGAVGAVNGVLGVSPSYHRHHRRGYYRNGRYYRRY
ncbi:MAG: hypothetical protein NTZ72_07150 [Afipia sp.]|nr:hypothetical protein [Afipia sp.]